MLRFLQIKIFILVIGNKLQYTIYNSHILVKWPAVFVYAESKL